MREWAAWKGIPQLQFPSTSVTWWMVVKLYELWGVLGTCTEFNVASCSKERSCSVPSKWKQWCWFPLFSSLDKNHELLYVFLISSESWDVEKGKCIDACLLKNRQDTCFNTGSIEEYEFVNLHHTFLYVLLWDHPVPYLAVCCTWESLSFSLPLTLWGALVMWWPLRQKLLSLMAPPAWVSHSFVPDLKVSLSFWVAESWDNCG